MSRLKGLRVYLSGACELASDCGASWRNAITPKLKGLGLTVLDPVNKNGFKLPFCESVDEFDYVKKLREEGNYEELSKCMKEIVRLDLRMVDCSDIIIVYLDKEIPTIGTIDELATASNQKKPVFLCSKQGKNNLACWLFGRIPPNYIFNDLNEIIQQLQTIAYCDSEDLHKYTDKRWVFTNKLGE